MSLRVDKRELAKLAKTMNEETTYIVAGGLRNEMTMHVEIRDLGGRQKGSDLQSLIFPERCGIHRSIGRELNSVLAPLLRQYSFEFLRCDPPELRAHLTGYHVRG